MSIQVASPLDVLNRMIAIDSDNGVPLHMQLRHTLQRAINEHFQDGQQFWTEQALIDQFKVSRITVRRALDELSREGMLQRERARGSFVRKSPATQNRIQFVGVFVPEWDSDFLSAMLKHLAVKCRQENLELQVYYTHKGEHVSTAYRAMHHSPKEESIILVGNDPQAAQELFEALRKRHFRVINIETLPKSEHLNSEHLNYVGVDNAKGMQLGVEHLMQLGHRRIALLVNEPRQSVAIEARVKAFKALQEKHHLEESAIYDCNTRNWEDPHEAAYNSMSRLWNKQRPPTAIFAVSDPGAWAALKWFSEQGIRVPEEVSVIGFDDSRPSRFVHPALTTLHHPIEEIAQQAVQWIIQGNDNAVEMLPPSLVVRQTTAPVPIEMVNTLAQASSY